MFMLHLMLMLYMTYNYFFMLHLYMIHTDMGFSFNLYNNIMLDMLYNSLHSLFPHMFHLDMYHNSSFMYLLDMFTLQLLLTLHILFSFRLDMHIMLDNHHNSSLSLLLHISHPNMYHMSSFMYSLDMFMLLLLLTLHILLSFSLDIYIMLDMFLVHTYLLHLHNFMLLLFRYNLSVMC